MHLNEQVLYCFWRGFEMTAFCWFLYYCHFEEAERYLAFHRCTRAATEKSGAWMGVHDVK